MRKARRLACAWGLGATAGAGDIIARPPGGPQTAHPLSNTGTAPLKAPCAETVEILHDPDSGKTAFGQRGVGPDGKPVMVRGMMRDADAQVGYWEVE